MTRPSDERFADLAHGDEPLRLQKLFREAERARASEKRLAEAMKRLLPTACQYDNCAEHDDGCRCVHCESRAALSEMEGE